MNEHTHNGDHTLGSLGEHRIIDEIIKPTFSTARQVLRGIGDDVAALRVTPGHEILVTTDPCPVPVISMLGDEDFWHWGRLTHVIGLSDLAASGARPVGAVVSTVMPETMRITEYRRYLDSLEHFASLWECPVVGGNIKDGREFSTCATVIGEAPLGTSLTRHGGRAGDAVCVIGNVGDFWPAVLSRLRGWSDLEGQHSGVFHAALNEPTPRVAEGLLLRESGLVTSCIDASDGLGAALQLLARSNARDVVIDEKAIPIAPYVREAARREGVHELALALSWGDWQLVFTADPRSARSMVDTVTAHGSPCRVVGHLGQAQGGQLLLEDLGGEARPIRSYASERFQRSSYFTHGLESYIDLMRQSPFE